MKKLIIQRMSARLPSPLLARLPAILLARLNPPLLTFPLVQMVGLLHDYFPVTVVGMPANYSTCS